MSEQRGRIESAAAAAAGGGAAGQPPSSGSKGQSADAISHEQPAVAFSRRSTEAFTADAAMSNTDGGSAPVVSSPTAAAAEESGSAAAAQPQSQPLPQGQAQGQSVQLAVDSPAVSEVVEAMAAVPAQPAGESVQQQLRLMDRLSQLLLCSSDDPVCWLRVTFALSVHQAVAILHATLRAKETGKGADALVSRAAAAGAAHGRRCNVAV